jgi:hypothetical protein
MAFTISKHIELTTGDLIKKFLTECRKVTDARMLNKITSKETRTKTVYSDTVKKYIRSLNLSH